MRTIIKNLVLLKASYGFVTEANYDSFTTNSGGIWDGYSQYSEPVRVEFVELSDDVKLAEELKALDKVIDLVRNEATIKLEELNTKRQELLALTYTKED